MMKDGVRGTPDVSALASRGSGRITILVWHYHDDDVPGPDADVRLDISGLPGNIRQAHLTHYRIDAEHSNVFNAWRSMGMPQQPTAAEYAKLEAASDLETLTSPKEVRVQDGVTKIAFTLPRQAVTLLVLEWK